MHESVIVGPRSARERAFAERRPTINFGRRLRQMILSVGALSFLFALHTSPVRDLIRHESLIRAPEIRPAALARENYMYSLSTQPALLGLVAFDFLLGLKCWRRWRITG